MKAYGVLTACNEYKDPNANLRGCVNDVRTVFDADRTVFNTVGWDFQILVNERNTAQAQKDALRKAVDQAQPGDIIHFHNSSHGTTIPDGGKTHHAVVPYDFDWNDLNTFVRDTDYWDIFSAAKNGVKIFTTSDSCFSGGLMGRAMPPRGRVIRSRYLPPPIDIQMMLDHHHDKGIVASPRGIVGDRLDLSYVSGCGPDQTSADVTGSDGRSFGAFTKYFYEALLANVNKTIAEITKICCANLVQDQYEQQPVAAGSRVNNMVFQ